MAAPIMTGQSMPAIVCHGFNAVAKVVVMNVTVVVAVVDVAVMEVAVVEAVVVEAVVVGVVVVEDVQPTSFNLTFHARSGMHFEGTMFFRKKHLRLVPSWVARQTTASQSSDSLHRRSQRRKPA
mmetsp:Transcript_60452/g.175071  ORF Transcript_60452/g.175071 Transcript_60452/m.175071 type:complete len:124 (-) Transcript_60452:1076-1447(-)